MIWVDREVKKLMDRKLPLEWVDDMKTPSGRIHVGSLRGVLVHDLVYKAFQEKGIASRFSYVFNDMDPMDAIPSYLDQKKWGVYAGKPLNKIPSPVEGYKSFATFYAQEFIDVFNSLNCHPQIIWSHELYESGKINNAIRLFLDNSEKVREIYKKVTKKERKSDWIPFNPVCEQCGNVGTTNAYLWDGTYVHYRCEPKIVDWATGCGYEGKTTPFDGRGKLPWKLDWPAHWKVIGITVESSGKDHMSSGGSYDMAIHFCKEILNIKPPDSLGGYEWFTVGGRKMSSSKGIGTSAKEVTEILPPEVFRFFMVRTPITTHLDFNPFGETIPNLFDDYDRCLNAYYDKREGKIPEGKQGDVLSDFARIIELSEVTPYSKKRPFLPRFRTVANLLAAHKNPALHFSQNIGNPLTETESAILTERIHYAKIYITKYAGTRTSQTNESEKKFEMNAKQKEFLSSLAGALKQLSQPDQETIQTVFFAEIKKADLPPKEAFQAFYQKLTGKSFGPKASDFILSMGVENVVNKL